MTQQEALQKMAITYNPTIPISDAEIGVLIRATKDCMACIPTNQLIILQGLIANHLKARASGNADEIHIYL